MKRTFNLCKAVLLTIGISFAVSMYAQPNLVSNWSFEDTRPLAPTTPVGSEFVPVPPATITDWTYVAGSIDVHNSLHWNMGSPHLDQHIDLNPDGIIEQVVSGLVIGATYTVNFHTSMHSLMMGGNIASASCEIIGAAPPHIWNRTRSGVGNFLSTPSNPPEAWTTETFNFVAATTMHTIRFRGLSSSYGHGGILVDAVSIRRECNANFYFQLTSGDAPPTGNEVEIFPYGSIVPGGGVYYEIDYGDGTGTTTSTTHTYPDGPGTYTICIVQKSMADQSIICSVCRTFCIGEVTEYEPPAFMAPGNNGKAGMNQDRNDMVPSQIKVYPNPAKEHADISFEILQQGHVKIQVLDIQGKVIREVLNKTLESGRQEVGISLLGLDAGVYNIRIETGGKVMMEKLSVIR